MNKFVNVIPANNENDNWSFKLKDTTDQNRENIKELIQLISSEFSCIEEERISSYYFRREDDNRQFAGIVCNKLDLSWIKFRINTVNFNVEDENIIEMSNYFFQGNNDSERQIYIIPENYVLIIECLKHAYRTSSIMNY